MPDAKRRCSCLRAIVRLGHFDSLEYYIPYRITFCVEFPWVVDPPSTGPDEEEYRWEVLTSEWIPASDQGHRKLGTNSEIGQKVPCLCA